MAEGNTPFLQLVVAPTLCSQAASWSSRWMLSAPTEHGGFRMTLRDGSLRGRGEVRGRGRGAGNDVLFE